MRRDLTDAMMRPYVVAAVQSLHPGLAFYDEVGVMHRRQACVFDVFGVSAGLRVGIEIKSDRDSFSRLTRQAAHYERHFDLVYVAVGERLFKKLRDIPPHFGVLLCYDGGDAIQVELVREATRLSPPLASVLSILWRDELVYLLRKHGLYKGMSKARMSVMRKTLLPVGEALLPDLDKLIREREHWKPVYPEPDEHVAVTLYEGDGWP